MCYRCRINAVTFSVCYLKVDFARELDIWKSKEEEEE